VYEYLQKKTLVTLVTLVHVLLFIQMAFRAWNEEKGEALTICYRKLLRL